MIRAVFLSAIALSGCTTASTTMLTPNTAQITAEDLSTGSRSAVRNRALLTAAQTAHAQGFEYFAVTSLEEKSRQDWFTTSGQMGLGGGGPPVHIPSRDLWAEMSVRFLHANELPADRDGIYQASAILARRN